MVRFKAALELARSALTAAALFLAGGVIPVLGAPLLLCAPAPILITALGRPSVYRTIAAALALTLAIIGGIAGPIQALAFALTLGIATVLIALTVRRRWRFEQIVVAAAAAVVAMATAALLLWAGSPAVLMRHLRESVAAALSHSADLYARLGVSESESRQIIARVLDITTQLAPALGAMLAGLMVLINLGLISRWLGKERLGYQLFGGLPTWRTPEWLIWALLATGFGMFIPQETARIAALNGFVLVAAVYFCQGLAIVAYYLQMLAMPRVVRGTIYLIALLQPMLAALVCLAGVFDMWIDFRRLKPPSQEAGSIDDFF